MKINKLFVYGELKPGYFEPKTITKAQPDKISGDLYDLGNDAAVKDVGNSKRHVDGFILEVSDEELEHIDDEEAPQFNRVQTVTWSGQQVWVYEYLKKIPKTSKLIYNWKEHHEKK